MTRASISGFGGLEVISDSFQTVSDSFQQFPTVCLGDTFDYFDRIGLSARVAE